MWVRRVMTPPCSCIMGRRYLAHEGRRLADRFSAFSAAHHFFLDFDISTILRFSWLLAEEQQNGW